ncbi:uncharacterized protein LOC127088218 isoform X2 [Lathyrus oleraceus]|uniref:uncharacterized protein LOC127088218 isoform X2 n=1 Tax=Pisum sativum TaxID=3888 RepID=UPI0021CEE415|nr:uncharacterized protein LOC127088218 isoform X2 [Pisum sativum]
MSSDDPPACCHVYNSDDNCGSMSNETAMKIIRGMVSGIGEYSVKRKKCAKKWRTDNIPAMKIANIAQVTNVANAGNQPINNGKVVIHDIKEEVVDTADVNRLMKENVMYVEKCVAKKTRGKKKSVGKYVDKKDKQKSVANAWVSNQVIEELVIRVKQYSWKSNIGNAKTNATNVMYFPRIIAKTCPRTNQTEIKVVDV